MGTIILTTLQYQTSLTLYRWPR